MALIKSTVYRERITQEVISAVIVSVNMFGMNVLAVVSSEDSSFSL